MSLVEPWEFGFFRSGIAAATLAGALCGLVGVYVVLRRMSYIGHGLSHAIFGGAVISFVAGINYYLGAGLWGVASALLIGGISRRRRIGADAAIGIITTASFAVGVALISRGNRINQNFEAVLFGNVLAVETNQVVVIAVVTLVSTLAILALYKQLLFMTFDPEVAPVYGVRATLVDGIFTIILAATIIATIQVLGVTLIAAALVIPPVVARLVSDSFKTVLVISVLVGAVCGFSGMYASYYLDIASGPTIVLTAATVFAATFVITAVARRLRRASLNSVTATVVVTVGLVGLLIPGCSSSDNERPTRPVVVTSIAPIGSLIRNVAGSRMHVETLVRPGTQGIPGTIEAGDAALVRSSSISMLVGLGYDDHLGAAVQRAARDDAPVIYLGPVSITPDALIRTSTQGGEVTNPFIWLDPVMARNLALRIKEELSAVDPGGAGLFEQNYAKVVLALDRMDRAVSETIATIPAGSRKLFTEVNAFDYFARRYGLGVIGSVRQFGEPGTSEPDTAALAATVRASGIPAVFATDPGSPAIDAIARRSGVTTVGMLRYENLPGPPGNVAYTYFGMILDDARNIAGGLGGETVALDAVRPNDVVSA